VEVAPTGGDHSVYYNTALELSRGGQGWLSGGTEFGYRAPLYFAFLSICFYLLGELPFWGVQLITAALGTCNCVLSGMLASKLWGVSTGRIAFWLVVSAVYIIEDDS
jgi:hypothetical protein